MDWKSGRKVRIHVWTGATPYNNRSQPPPPPQPTTPRIKVYSVTAKLTCPFFPISATTCFGNGPYRFILVPTRRKNSLHKLATPRSHKCYLNQRMIPIVAPFGIVEHKLNFATSVKIYLRSHAWRKKC
jgi:hypothetical protein